MALKSSINHYTWDTIQIRHWLIMAKTCYFSEQKMQEIITSVFDQMDAILAKVEQKLPDHFPSQIKEAIFNGMQMIKNRAQASYMFSDR